MINKEFLEKYTLEELRLIYRKIAVIIKSFCEDSYRTWCINKIYSAYNSFLDNIIDEIENENIVILPKIKLYFLGVDDIVGNYNKTEIEVALKEWGLYIDGVGCESNIEKVLVDRYRKEVVFCNIDNYTISSIFPKYLSLILFVFELYKGIDSMEKFQKYKKGKDEIINYVSGKGFLQVKHPTKKTFIYSLNKLDLRNVFTNDKELMELVMDFYNYVFLIEKYSEYLIDLEKVKHIQQNRDEWIKFDEIKIICQEKLNILEKFNLIKIHLSNNNVFVKLTDMALSLIEGKLAYKWDGEVLYLSEDGKEIIAINDNPIKITRALINKTLLQQDVLFIFE